MNRLLRELAPVTDAAWSEVDGEAARTLRHFLVARRLVDFSGPHGWERSAESLGEVEDLPGSGPDGGVAYRRRLVQPLVELECSFTMPRAALEAVDRGREGPDLDEVTAAAEKAALAEDDLVFNGLAGTGVTGIVADSPHTPLDITDDYNDYPGLVARAVSVLRRAGVGGPFAIALGPRCYTGVVETTEHGGYPVLEHIRLILGGPVVWAPTVDGAVVLSQRGGDFAIVSGADFAVRYVEHDRDTVTFAIQESVTFRNVGPEAAIALRYPGSSGASA